MKSYRESDIYQLMDKSGAISNAIVECVKNLDNDVIVNKQLTKSLDLLKRVYRETITNDIAKAVEDGSILVINPRLDKRLPANMPFIKAAIDGQVRVIVDISKYGTTIKNDLGKPIDIEIQPSKLYNLLVPAFLSLHLFNKTSALPAESIKALALMWARLFSKILISKRVFIGSVGKQEAFTYFAMRFFMLYYLESPMPLVDSISKAYINEGSRLFIEHIDNHIKMSGIDIYKNLKTFATTMFSNEVTNIKMDNKVNIESFLKMFDTYLGKDGAYLSLWAPDLFLYCCIITHNKEFILNDRAWEDIVGKNKSTMIKLLDSLYKEI